MTKYLDRGVPRFLPGGIHMAWEGGGLHGGGGEGILGTPLYLDKFCSVSPPPLPRSVFPGSTVHCNCRGSISGLGNSNF
jgi:hypothetical protein